MKVWKLVSGILSIVLFGVVMFQSCAAGLVISLEENTSDASAGGGYRFRIERAICTEF